MEKILAIDDDPEILEIISASLKKYIPGCIVMTTQSGDEGIEKAKTEQPDTILLDINMPDMNGFEVCKKLKADEETKHIPIIILTGMQADVKSRIKGLNLGADAFLSKPIGGAELVSQVKVMLRIRRTEEFLRREKGFLEDLVLERTKALAWEASVNEAIAELSGALISSLSIETISLLVLDKAKKLTGSMHGYAAYIDPATGYLTARRDIRDDCHDENKNFIFKEFKGLWGWVLKNRKPLLTNAPAKDPRSSGTLPGHIQIRRFLSVPAQIDEKLAGQISVANSESDYTENDLRLVERLSVLYAIAIHRRHAEKKLVKAREDAEAASRAKSQFLANLSHEIRTPMNGVIGMLDLAIDTKLNAKQREYLSLAKYSADSLLHLLNEMLDLSRIEAGKLEISRVRFNLSSLIKSAMAPVKLQAEEKGLNLRYEILSDVPDLLGDPDRLRQIIVNILRNAVKFTEKGGIFIQVKQKNNGVSPDPHASRFTLQFSISDTGIGIPKDKCDSIFDPFFQVDGSVRRSYEGIGLGLSICRQLTELMGGCIEVKSEVGKGSVFSFTVAFNLQGELSEFQASETPKASDISATPPNVPRDKIRILVVEDHWVSRKAVRNFLSADGYKVITASNGKMALEALECMRFNLVLMDIQMPGMDGIEATKAIRNSEGGMRNKEGAKFRIPIIALTAHAFKEDRKRCLEAGMDDYVTKPIKRVSLLKVVEKFIPEAASCKASDAEFGMKNINHSACDSFLDQTATHIRELKGAISSGDESLMEYHARKLKDMASDSGAYRIGDEIFRLQLAVRKGDTVKCGLLLERVEKAFDKLKVLLSDQ